MKQSIKLLMSKELTEWLTTDDYWFLAVRKISTITYENGWSVLPALDKEGEWDEIFKSLSKKELESFLKAMFGKSFSKLKQATRDKYIPLCNQAMELLSTYEVRKKIWREKKLNTIIRNKTKEDRAMEKKTASKPATKVTKATPKKAASKKKVAKKKASGGFVLEDNTMIVLKKPELLEGIRETSNRGKVAKALVKGATGISFKALKGKLKLKAGEVHTVVYALVKGSKKACVVINK